MQIASTFAGNEVEDSEQPPPCVPLHNRGSHFTVEVQVGTPPQKFDLLADTGSDAVVVSSCLCHQRRKCFPHSKCFKGAGASSSFSMHDAKTGGPPIVDLHFGSGDIRATLATDVVRVDNVSATMYDALHLMIDHRLQIDGPFEGILGLGLPARQVPSVPKTSVGFMAKAHVQRFSVCFNDQIDGVFRLNTPQNSNSLGSVGQVHWGLRFAGVSVGVASAPVRFCSRKALRPGQDSACGAIPDSGTTLMMGPAEHLVKLFDGLCDEWSWCRAEAAQTQQDKYKVFQELLFQCESWLAEENSLDGLPALHFHVAGAGSEVQVLTIPAASYILEVEQDKMHYLKNSAVSMLMAELPQRASQPSKICFPAFGELNYVTERNGPVWILGMPLFYEFQVIYDLAAKPPGIAFSDSPCGSCRQSELFLSTKSGRAGLRRPRQLRGPPRLPAINTTWSRKL